MPTGRKAHAVGAGLYDARTVGGGLDVGGGNPHGKSLNTVMAEFDFFARLGLKESALDTAAPVSV